MTERMFISLGIIEDIGEMIVHLSASYYLLAGHITLKTSIVKISWLVVVNI